MPAAAPTLNLLAQIPGASDEVAQGTSAIRPDCLE